MYVSILYPKLRNNEFIQFFKNLTEILQSNDPEKLNIKIQLEELLPVLVLFADLYKPDRGSEITEELQEIDAQRDSCLQGIELQIKSFTHHYKPAKQEAAIQLSNSLETYGTGIARQNYQAETSTVNSILSKWEKERILIKSLTVLNLTDWADVLKSLNTQFNEKYLTRIADQAEAPEQKSIDLRVQIIDKYRTLMAHLQAYTTLSRDNSYEKVNKQINTLIEQYNKMLTARSSSKEEVLEQE